MLKLLRKEFRLAAHPTNYLFLGLSAMLLIPSYPYYVTFFYTSLGLFFTCLGGRENHDIEYSMNLPIRKRDIVKGRFGFAVAIELMQMLVAVPFAILRGVLSPEPNMAGMDANVAFFGLALLLLGAYNLVFFPRYYRNPDKVGRAFAVSSAITFLGIAALEAMSFALPLFRERLDTPDPLFLGEKLVVLGAGLALYALATALAYRLSVKRFERIDL